MTDEKPVTPFDMFRAIAKTVVGIPDQFVSDEVANERLSICKDCPNYRKKVGQCKLCGCHMPSKVKLPGAYCPMSPPKWDTAPAAN